MKSLQHFSLLYFYYEKGALNLNDIFSFPLLLYISMKVCDQLVEALPETVWGITPVHFSHEFLAQDFREKNIKNTEYWCFKWWLPAILFNVVQRFLPLLWRCLNKNQHKNENWVHWLTFWLCTGPPSQNILEHSFKSFTLGSACGAVFIKKFTEAESGWILI